MQTVTPVSQQRVMQGGVGLHCETYGTGNDTILFVPPWSFVHSRCFKAQIPYFSQSYRCITWDPRGNGKSDRPTSNAAYNLDQYTRDILAVMNATDTESAILMGFSLSALSCAAVSAFHPEKVKAIVTSAGVSTLSAGFEYKSADKYNAPAPERPHGWEKFNRAYWLEEFGDFARFFTDQIFVEPHSTKQREDTLAWSRGTSGEVLSATLSAPLEGDYQMDANAYKRISCPMLLVHGSADSVVALEASQRVAKLTSGQLEVFEGAGHAPQLRYPAKFNVLMRDFLAKVTGHPVKKPLFASALRPKRALYLSSPIGLGHAYRDLAISKALREKVPDLKVEWLAQDPVIRVLNDENEWVHPASQHLSSESAHIEEESGEHDLNVFQAIRRMDELMVKNFQVFQDVLESSKYDLVIADEAWEVDHFWHEHNELKKAPLAWLTDFVGWIPMPDNGTQEAELTTDYNAEMIEHIEAAPALRDRAIFIGNQADIVAQSFGTDLPDMQDWVPDHYEFSGYVLGTHPNEFGSRDDLRQQLGYAPDERVCIVTVGGSGVGAVLIKRIMAAVPYVRMRLPELRIVLVTGPRLNPASFAVPAGVEAHAYVPWLNRHLAACDLAIVQGGLSTTMELAAAGTPFLYFPLKNHFEQNFHVAHRLDRYRAGRRMDFDSSTPEVIAAAMQELLVRPYSSKPVESDGALRVANMLAELL